jgi:hypothetical protein
MIMNLGISLMPYPPANPPAPPPPPKPNCHALD